jgi:hypothetical protein
VELADTPSTTANLDIRANPLKTEANTSQLIHLRIGLTHGG